MREKRSMRRADDRAVDGVRQRRRERVRRLQGNEDVTITGDDQRRRTHAREERPKIVVSHEREGGAKRFARRLTPLGQSLAKLGQRSPAFVAASYLQCPLTIVAPVHDTDSVEPDNDAAMVKGRSPQAICRARVRTPC